MKHIYPCEGYRFHFKHRIAHAGKFSANGTGGKTGGRERILNTFYWRGENLKSHINTHECLGLFRGGNKEEEKKRSSNCRCSENYAKRHSRMDFVEDDFFHSLSLLYHIILYLKKEMKKIIDENLHTLFQKLCIAYHIRPHKDRGQHFLAERSVLEKIVSTADIHRDDVVVEVGPGFGLMTLLLARRAKKVIAVEIDRKLVEALQAQTAGCRNLEIVHNDILRFQPRDYGLQDRKYIIVANLPYRITSFFLRKFLTRPPRPSFFTLLVQKEVGERICAQPGQMSKLAVSVQFYAVPKIIDIVPRSCFWPQPEVDSVLITLATKSAEILQRQLLRAGTDEKRFFRLVQFGFSSKRKQLQNNLAAGWRSYAGQKVEKEKVRDILKKAGIHENARAQDLSLDQWLDVSRAVENFFLVHQKENLL